MSNTTTEKRGGWRTDLTLDEIAIRALIAVAAVPTPPEGAPADAGGRPANYRLPYPNGGNDLLSAFTLTGPCGSAWAFGDRTPVKDCIGHALACSGIDRKQPGYRGLNGEWLNCASIVHDARTERRFFRQVPDNQAKPGMLLVDDEHIGVIVRAILKWVVDKDGDGKIEAGETMKLDFLVSDCSPRHGRETAVGLGGRWSSDCIVVAPVWIK